MKKSAPTNTAARLLGGDTTHATYKLPRGTMLGRRAKLSGPVLRRFRRAWKHVRVHAIDEISVLPPHALFHIDLRSRQAKQDEHHTFGNLATCVCGDFLQLPPVEEPSLAMPLDEEGYMQQVEPEAQGAEKDEKEERRERREFEHRSGFEIWRECFTVVTCLNLNMRTEGVLADILQGMRDGLVSDDAWKALQGRVLGMYTTGKGRLQRYPAGMCDPRLLEEPFLSHPISYIVHRHQLRVCQSFCNAVLTCQRAAKRLYVSVASDDVAAGGQQLTDELRTLLFKRCNLRQVQNLPSALPLFRGIRLLLYSKECVRLGLMNGCLCELEDIIFAEEET